MEYVNAKRSFNAAKGSLMSDKHNNHLTFCGPYQIVQSIAGEVTEYSLITAGETSGSFREIVFPDCWIQISSLHLPHALCLHNETKQDLYQMRFRLSGQLPTPDCITCFDIISGTSNFLFLPKHLPDCQKPGENHHYISFEVNFLPAYFHAQFAGFLNAYPDFCNSVRKNETGFLSDAPLTMPPRLRQIVADIIQCRQKPPFNKVYLEAKVQELLVLQMENFNQQRQQRSKLNSEDRAKLGHVKDMLISRRTPPSLHELSLESGLNLDKLKKGFKTLYGDTVFGYLTNIKMEEARQRLLSIDTTVSEVAEKAGYKNPQHFTAAFKRKYGVLPRDMRQ